MTTLEFSYDLDKDIDNFLRGTRSKNNPKPTKLQQSYIDKHGPAYNEDTVREFIKTNIAETGFNSEEAVRKIENEWRPIEEAFFSRANAMFGIEYPIPKIHVYLSTNARCTYRIEDGYFFVYANSKSPHMILMHELMHFYTWEAFHSELESKGVSPALYNDMKESLTVLLNTEFADLMREAKDEGYPQHAGMRADILMLWEATKDIRRTIYGVLPG